MNGIEKRAREVEAALREQVSHHRDLSNPLFMSTHGRLLHQAAELIAALTPSGGFVLVPVEPTEEMLKVGYSWMMGRIVMRSLYDELLAARPEVSP